MTIYPTRQEAIDARYGGQRLPAGYVPIPLDSEREAVERMLVAADGDVGRDGILAAGLDGSDEVGTVTQLLDEMLAEKRVMDAIDPMLCKDATEYKARLMDTATTHLDVNTWVLRKAMVLGGVMPYGIDAEVKEL